MNIFVTEAQRKREAELSIAMSNAQANIRESGRSIERLEQQLEAAQDSHRKLVDQEAQVRGELADFYKGMAR